MTTNNNELVNLHSLADAIIIQACEDYRSVLRGTSDDPDAMLSELMRFFESDWYELLTKIDYHHLIAKMDKEWEDGKKLITAGCEVDCPKAKKRYKFTCPLCGKTAEVHIKRIKTPKRKYGSQTISYYKVFECSCHRPEQILLRQEVVNG